jgi:hypothetical protein
MFVPQRLDQQAGVGLSGNHRRPRLASFPHAGSVIKTKTSPQVFRIGRVALITVRHQDRTNLVFKKGEVFPRWLGAMGGLGGQRSQQAANTQQRDSKLAHSMPAGRREAKEGAKLSQIQLANANLLPQPCRG